MSWVMMYDVAEGIVYEFYEIINNYTWRWNKVRLTSVKYSRDTGEEIICNEYGQDHPALPGRMEIGQLFTCRNLKDLVTETGQYQCLKIHFGNGRIGVATYDPILDQSV